MKRSQFWLRQRAQMTALAGCVVALLLGATPVAAQLDVDQLEVFVRSVGSERVGTFRVTNRGGERVTSRLSLNDWRREIDGTNVFVPSGEVPGACGGRFDLFPTVASLGAGESQVVRVEYRGDSLDVMCWGAVVVEVAPGPPSQTGGASIAAELRSAVKLYVQPTTTRLDVKVTDLDVGAHRPRHDEARDDTLSTDVIATFRNDGNVQVRAKVRVEYRNAADSVVAFVRDDDVPMLPSAPRQWRTRIPVLNPGRYVVLVLVDYGGADIVAGQMDLELTP